MGLVMGHLRNVEGGHAGMLACWDEGGFDGGSE